MTAVALLVAAAVATGWVPSAAAQQDGFVDVTGGVHKPGIDALDARGVIAGTECAEGMFCPGLAIKRSAAAVWLVRALDGDEPAAVSESRFADVDPDEWWMPYVERLAGLEITVGCQAEPLRFCPDQPVTRAQMATFLIRAFDLEAAPSAGFADTRGSIHEASIDALAAAGVTAGCKVEPLSFCPYEPVTRAQMATLLARALGDVPLPPAFSWSLPSHCSGWTPERPHDPPEAGCPQWWSHLFDLEPTPEGLTADEMRTRLAMALPNYVPHRLAGGVPSASDGLDALPGPARELIANTLVRLAGEDPATAASIVTITAVAAACAYPTGINIADMENTTWWLQHVATVVHEWAHVRDYRIAPGGWHDPEWCKQIAERAGADEASGRLVTYAGLLEAASPAHNSPLRSGPGCAAALIARFAHEIDSHDQPGNILELSANAQTQVWMRRAYASAEARWWAAEAAAQYPQQHPPLDPPLEWAPFVEVSRPQHGSCDDLLPTPEVCTTPDNCHEGMHRHPFLTDTLHYHRGGLEPHTHHHAHIIVDGVAVPTNVAPPDGGYCEYPDGRRTITGYSPGKVFGEPVWVGRMSFSPDGVWHYAVTHACVYITTPGHPRHDPRFWLDNPTGAESARRLREWDDSAVCKQGHATQAPELYERIWQRCGQSGTRCPTEAEFADGEYDGGWVACGDRDSGYFDNICRATTGEPLS